MPDREQADVQIAQRSLEPLVFELRSVLTSEDVSNHSEDQLLVLAARIYVAGHRDGQREATGQIAVEASRFGLHLALAPDLTEPHPERDAHQRDGEAVQERPQLVAPKGPEFVRDAVG